MTHSPARADAHALIKEIGVMADLVLIALTVAVFAVLGLVVKAVGRL